MPSLQILADVNIPCVEEAFGRFGTVRTQPGRNIGPAEVENADILLVRSVTSVGPSLLEGSAVRFVGSATIGTDHVDLAYLRENDIRFAHAPGSNADSVADYVVVALLELARKKHVSLQDRTVGIVGCGNIGSRLARRLPALGMTVLCNDPPRVEAADARGETHDFVDLDTLLTRADILTLHVPLTTGGLHPTHHLIDADMLARLKDGSWLLNTSRGPVVDGTALREALERGPLDGAVLDVWEGEPSPDPLLVQAVDVATPHIAGYAYDGKVRGTAMLYDALCDFLGVTPTWDPSEALQPTSQDELRLRPPDPRLPVTDWLCALARQGYDIRTDDTHLRALFDGLASDGDVDFSPLRKDYRRRRELQQHTVRETLVPQAYRRATEQGLCMQLA